MIFLLFRVVARGFLKLGDLPVANDLLIHRMQGDSVFQSTPLCMYISICMYVYIYYTYIHIELYRYIYTSTYAYSYIILCNTIQETTDDLWKHHQRPSRLQKITSITEQLRRELGAGLLFDGVNDAGQGKT